MDAGTKISPSDQSNGGIISCMEPGEGNSRWGGERMSRKYERERGGNGKFGGGEVRIGDRVEG